MNLSIKKLCFLFVAAAVAFSGCSKKPKRPDPSATVLGPDTIGAGAIGDLGGAAPGTDLASRGGALDPTQGDRQALAAQTVYFDYDQSALKASERAKLDAAKAYLDSNPNARVLLEGHCDWRGTQDYNLGLGDRRANAVKQYLTTLGVTAERLEVLSKGDLDAVENADEATMAKDRRVELVVFN